MSMISRRVSAALVRQRREHHARAAIAHTTHEEETEMAMRDNKQVSAERDVQESGERREGQDRAKPSAKAGGAKSPVDSMHVDAPKQQDNARGHRQKGS